MSDAPWWEPAFRWGIRLAWIFVAVSLVGAWLGRARRPAIAKEGSQVLTHSWRTRILAAVSAGLLAGLATLALRFTKSDERWVALLFAAAASLGGVFVADAVRLRHELTNDGITYRGLWRRYDCIPWNAMVSARWNDVMKWLTVSIADGRVLRFPSLMNGFDTLALALYERVPALETDRATERVLADARRGRLPRVW